MGALLIVVGIGSLVIAWPFGALVGAILILAGAVLLR